MGTDTAMGGNTSDSISGARRLTAAAIGLVTTVVSLIVLWQIVRIWQGALPNPFTLLMAGTFGEVVPDESSSLAGLIRSGLNFLGACAIVMPLAYLVATLGSELSRVTLLGVEGYKHERRERLEYQRRYDDVMGRRDERLASRRKAEPESKSSFSVTTLLIGIAIGALFF